MIALRRETPPCEIWDDCFTRLMPVNSEEIICNELLNPFGHLRRGCNPQECTKNPQEHSFESLPKLSINN